MQIDVPLMITGAVVGFLVAAPVGPVAVLCVQRTLLDGRDVGFGTGLGASVGDALFGALAVFSVAAVEGLLLENRPLFQILASLVLVALGVWTVATGNSRRYAASGTRAAQPSPRATRPAALFQAFGSAFAITVVNPITLMAFVSMFTALQVADAVNGLLGSWLVIGGVLVGSALWWFLLCGIASVFRESFTDKGIRWMNAVSGLAICGFGVAGFIDLALR